MRRDQSQTHSSSLPVAAVLGRQGACPAHGPLVAERSRWEPLLDWLERQPPERIRLAAVLGCAAFWAILAISFLRLV